MKQQIEILDILSQVNLLIYDIVISHYPFLSEKKIVNFSNREDLGQFQSNISFIMAKSDKIQSNPKDIAEEIVKILSDIKEIKNISQVNGFVNFSLSDEFLLSFVNKLSEENNYLIRSIKKQKVILDFGGPNIAKSMHVGHLRSSIIGDSLQRIYRFFGNEVISDIHLGDWGLPIGMIIMKLQLDNKNLSDEEIIENISIGQLEYIYPLAAEECKNNLESRKIAQKITMELQNSNNLYIKYWEKIVEVSIISLKNNYDKLNIKFDLWYGESSVNYLINNLLQKMLNQNIARKDDSAIIADTSYDSPLILANSEGAVTYGMTDIATIYYRLNKLSAEKIIYIVDKRQSLHFKQVFEVSSKIFAERELICEHIGFGTLNGKDGKPFKTRAGGVMKLEDLIDLTTNKILEKMNETVTDTESIDFKITASIIAIAAIKFADLSKYRMTDYVFDIDQFTDFQGKTGPYLVYNYIRIKSILGKISEKNYNIYQLEKLPKITEIENLLNHIIKFYFYLEKSYIENAPNHLCEYLFNLAQLFSSFYSNVNVINNKNQEERGALIKLLNIILFILEKGLNLLGIEVDQVKYM